MLTSVIEQPNESSTQLRLFIVESDPALRGILRSLLREMPDISVAGAVGDARAAMEEDLTGVDVMLIDLDETRSEMSGTQLAIELKLRHRGLGIVLLLAHSFTDPLPSVPDSAQQGWAFIEKGDDFEIVRLSRAIRACAWGLNIHDPRITRESAVPGRSLLDSLTERQRQVIGLAATGIDSGAIGRLLEMKPVAVRQELSRVYGVLVPDPKPGTDLRTVAVLRYLRLANGSAESSLVDGTSVLA